MSLHKLNLGFSQFFLQITVYNISKLIGLSSLYYIKISLSLV